MTSLLIQASPLWLARYGPFRPFCSLYAPLCSPFCSPVLLSAHLILFYAPSVLSLMLSLKRLYSLSRTETSTPNPKFGVYIKYIYYIHPELRIGRLRFRLGKRLKPLRVSMKGAPSEQWGSAGEQNGAAREQWGATKEQTKGAQPKWGLIWLPSTRAIATHVVDDIFQQFCLARLQSSSCEPLRKVHCLIPFIDQN